MMQGFQRVYCRTYLEHISNCSIQFIAKKRRAIDIRSIRTHAPDWLMNRDVVRQATPKLTSYAAASASRLTF